MFRFSSRHRSGRLTGGFGRVQPRLLTAGVASFLIGAAVLGAATSSAQQQPASVRADSTTLEVTAAEILRGDARGLTGFAPPAASVGQQQAAAVRALAPALPPGPLGIPGIVLQAYKLAANRVAAENASCRLPWFLLAGIGRIESGHAGNGSVDASGTTINPIEGPLLDGTLAGNAVITDTDKGAIDGDAAHDRAMGPMQFIPSTWAAWGSDANGDGKADPNNVFDATYAAGRYLCSGVSDIMSAAHRVSAVLRYNNSIDYATNVLTWALAYATGVTPTAAIPEPKRPPVTTVSPSAPGTRAPRAAGPGQRPVPSTTQAAPRFSSVGAPFTASGTIEVTTPAGPVSCSIDLAGSTTSDGAAATVAKATLGGGNALCGLARTVGVPWTLTPISDTTVTLSNVGVDALGAHCGPVALSGALTGSLTATAQRGGTCTVRALTLHPTRSLTLS